MTGTLRTQQNMNDRYRIEEGRLTWFEHSVEMLIDGVALTCADSTESLLMQQGHLRALRWWLDQESRA